MDEEFVLFLEGILENPFNFGEADAEWARQKLDEIMEKR